MISDDFINNLSKSLEKKNKKYLLGNIPHGSEAIILSKISKKTKKNILFICENKKKYNQTKDMLNFYETENLMCFPEYDTKTYDRISPNKKITSERVKTLIELQKSKENKIVLTTVKSATQRIADKTNNFYNFLYLNVGRNYNIDEIRSYLSLNGYSNTSYVREAGEFTVRGGIIDLYPYNSKSPKRLDFFGNKLDTIKNFNANTQLSINETIDSLIVYPCNEIILCNDLVNNFRVNFNSEFGSQNKNSKLYDSVSNQIQYPGIESWFPFFYKKNSTIIDYCYQPIIILDNNIFEIIEEHKEILESQFKTRNEYDYEKNNNEKYHALSPDKIFLSSEKLKKILNKNNCIQFYSFKHPSEFNLQAGNIKNFYSSDKLKNINYKELKKTIDNNNKSNKKTFIACSSEGSRQRLQKILKNQNISSYNFENISDLSNNIKNEVGLCILNLNNGFHLEEVTFLSEQDIFGEKFYRARKIENKNFLKDISSINPNDLVVHIDHGLGRFVNLTNLKIEDSYHECLMLEYRNQDRLYLPVENLEMLSKYNSNDENIILDRLGSDKWKIKKEKIKKDIMKLASELIDVAAKRKLANAEKFNIKDEFYHDFCSKFPFEETEDQLNSIDSVLDDLTKGLPMDRLVCGDVGFGKTEVAIRASFVVALDGKQVVILAPTTLLARQHYETFKSRFTGMPINVVELSRLSKNKSKIIEKINTGSADIVIGTHALLTDKIEFKNLGLLIVDEEQHFGVKHKEKLKKLKSDIHVLTLTATPIPRTMQLAMTGVKDLSVIASPPIDRRSIETFIFKKDNIVIKEALLNEKKRGGQSFYVVPRIKDIETIEKFIKENIPEINYVIAHGQMSSTNLENRMHDFYEGIYDVLISTSIIESGLDVANANTIIVHKANLFGLSQLYQIRGRVGRSNVNAYAYITYENDYHLGSNALKRLEAIQSLNSLGAGFNLASYDLNIRGSGNILGEQQSGHIKEIGIELYQEMLEETILELKNSDKKSIDEKWSPKITLDLPILIPSSYIEDVNLRMEIYRKLSNLNKVSEIELFEVELIDRFGKYPNEVDILFRIIAIKIKCKKLNIEKIKKTTDGFLIQFRNNLFNNPSALLEYINQSDETILKPDEKIIFKGLKKGDILNFIDKKLEDIEFIHQLN